MSRQAHLTEADEAASSRYARTFGEPSSHAEESTTRHLARHAVELGELQFQLLVSDLQALSRAARTATLLLITGAVVLIASVLVFLLALAAWFQSQFELTMVESLVLSGAIALLTTAVLFASGWAVAKGGTGKLDRSREEFRRNLQWAKEMLTPTPPDIHVADPNSPDLNATDIHTQHFHR